MPCQSSKRYLKVRSPGGSLNRWQAHGWRPRIAQRNWGKHGIRRSFHLACQSRGRALPTSHQARFRRGVNRTSLGALFTVLAMLAFASMDAMSKWLVADYAIGQLMWLRYAVFCLFAWFVVRRQGLAAAARTPRPWLQGLRALLATVESVVFVLAFRYLPLADTHAVAATSPLIVIALGVLFLDERAGLARWLAVGAGFLG